jgi:hypothetical protein
VYSICYWDEVAISSVDDVYVYVIIIKLLYFIFNIILVLIRQWEFQTCLHRNFLQ